MNSILRSIFGAAACLAWFLACVALVWFNPSAAGVLFAAGLMAIFVGLILDVLRPATAEEYFRG
jgi:membrane-bound metal-dependent hydrolase YbcI (DUF457 family)